MSVGLGQVWACVDAGTTTETQVVHLLSSHPVGLIIPPCCPPPGVSRCQMRAQGVLIQYFYRIISI